MPPQPTTPPSGPQLLEILEVWRELRKAGKVMAPSNLWEVKEENEDRRQDHYCRD